jgi:hypothetical protein
MLHGKVHVIDERGQPPMGFDQRGSELLRMARRVADPLDPGDGRDGVEQVRELPTVEPPGVDVLPEQRHLANALAGEALDLGDDGHERARDLVAARVRHDAVAAVLGAALHDGDERGRPFGAGRRQGIELLDGGEVDVDLGRARRAGPLDHLRQPVQGLRPEHEVDVRRAADDRRAFLAGNATADADQSALCLQVLEATEVAEHLLLRLLAHRAGVEEDEVGRLDVLRRLPAVRGAKRVDHAVGVVDVHLAAEGLDPDLRGTAVHGRDQLCVAGS